MPNSKSILEKQKKGLQAEIAELYFKLTGQERREVLAATAQSEETLRRYATDRVAKISTGELFRDEMRSRLAARGTAAAV